jgi:transcriptional/translational regulatory protein YebC/TACO1
MQFGGNNKVRSIVLKRRKKMFKQHKQIAKAAKEISNNYAPVEELTKIEISLYLDHPKAYRRIEEISLENNDAFSIAFDKMFSKLMSHCFSASMDIYAGSIEYTCISSRKSFFDLLKGVTENSNINRIALRVYTSNSFYITPAHLEKLRNLLLKNGIMLENSDKVNFIHHSITTVIVLDQLF